jgi:hypothetical protein
MIMAEEEKKEEVKAEEKNDGKAEARPEEKNDGKAEAKPEEKKEKKEGFWSKLKKNISDSNREGNIESAYNKSHPEFELYTGNGLFDGKNVHGDLDEKNLTLTVFGKADFPYSTILVTIPANRDKELPKMFYVTGAVHSDKNNVSVTVKEDDKDVVYVRPSTVLTLATGVTEVKVIKVHDSYYLKKEEPKKDEPKPEEKKEETK